MWPNCWQLWNCVRVLWDLYASNLMAIWQRLGRWTNCWDFAVLGNVTKKKGEVYCFGFLERGPTGGCHMLEANNVKAEAHQPVTNVFWGGGGVFCGRWRIPAFISF
jgi:hypothetical protein